MKFSIKITSGIILIFMIVMGYMTFFGGSRIDDDKGNSDNNAFPNITSEKLYNGLFGKELVSYTAEHFAGRDIWNTIGAEINARVGEPIVNGVYITEDRLLAVGSPNPQNMEKSAASVNEFAEKYDGAVYFVAVPTSTGIYGDILPSYMMADSEKQQADNIYGKLSADIRRIDAYSILKMLSDNYIYYRSDTKWTSYGAYCVYRTVIQKLGFMPVSYDQYTVRHVTDSYYGNLYGRTSYMESKSDILDIYECENGAEITSCMGYDSNGISYTRELYEADKAETNEKYNLYLGEPLPLVKINTTVNNDKRILVIGDEFASCFIPFLAEHYSEIAVISADQADKPLEDYVDPNEYGQTLFLLGIDSLSENILEKI